jgi:hypothetical protein
MRRCMESIDLLLLPYTLLLSLESTVGSKLFKFRELRVDFDNLGPFLDKQYNKDQTKGSNNRRAMVSRKGAACLDNRGTLGGCVSGSSTNTQAATSLSPAKSPEIATAASSNVFYSFVSTKSCFHCINKSTVTPLPPQTSTTIGPFSSASCCKKGSRSLVE